MDSASIRGETVRDLVDTRRRAPTGSGDSHSVEESTVTGKTQVLPLKTSPRHGLSDCTYISTYQL